MKMRKGFTLIELVATISLMCILLSIGLGSLNYVKSIKNELEIRQSLYEIIDLITYGKNYCYSNKVSGNFSGYLDDDFTIIKFTCKDGTNIKTNLPAKLKFLNEGWISSMDSLQLSINSTGRISETTIRIKDEENDTYTISILVGSNSINLKGGDLN